PLPPATALGSSRLTTAPDALARQLASKDHARRLNGVGPEVSADGALTIPGSSTLLWSRHYSEFAAVDHTVALLEILGTRNEEGAEALVFHRSQSKGLRVS